MVPRWRIFGDFLRPIFSASRVQHISHLRPKFALIRHIMYASMVDIQSGTAEIRRGKKKKKEEEETTEQKYNDLPYFIWRP